MWVFLPAVAVYVLFVAPMSRVGDLWSHLALGEVFFNSLIIGLGLPYQDIFTYTCVSCDIERNEWLGQILLYLVSEGFGEWGLRCLGAFLVLALFYPFLKNGKSRIGLFGLFAAALYFLILRESYEVRPALMGLVFFAGISYWLLNRPRILNWRECFVLFALTLLWVNVHSSALILLPMMALYTLFLYGKNKIALIYPGIVFFSLMVHPLGWEIFSSSWHISVLGKSLGVGEWQTPTLGLENLAFWQVVFLSGLAWLVCFFKLSSSNSRLRLAVAALFILLPLFAIRHQVFLWLPLLLLSKEIATLKGLQLTRSFLVVSFGAIGMGMLLHQRVWETPQVIAPPQGAVQFIKAVGLEGPVFNYQPWGAYLFFNLFPTSRVALDSRISLHGPLIAKMKESERVLGYVDVKRLLAGFPETRILVHVPQLAVAGYLNQWEVVYRDEKSLVALKKTPRNRHNFRKLADYRRAQRVSSFVHAPSAL